MLESGWFVAELLVEVMKRHLQESTILPSAVKSSFVVVLHYYQLINCCQFAYLWSLCNIPSSKWCDFSIFMQLSKEARSGSNLCVKRIQELLCV